MVITLVRRDLRCLLPHVKETVSRHHIKTFNHNKQCLQCVTVRFVKTTAAYMYRVIFWETTLTHNSVIPDMASVIVYFC